MVNVCLLSLDAINYTFNDAKTLSCSLKCSWVNVSSDQPGAILVCSIIGERKS